MANQSNPYLLERIVHYFDVRFDKYRTVFEILLTLALAAFPFAVSSFLSLPQHQPGGDLMTAPMFSPAGITTIILFYIIAFCVWMLYRNNTRLAKESRLKEERTNALLEANSLRQEKTNILLEAIATKLGVDTTELLKLNKHDEDAESGGGI